MPRVSHEDYETLPWVEVDSSNLHRVAWVWTEQDEEAELGALTVEFHGGRMYVYADVNRETYEELLEAESVGRYFNENVKSNHDAARVELVVS